MKTSKEKKKPIVCAYYFPNWHSDPRNDKWHGTGWTEWEVAKCARPRFPGHQQPKVPVWGYEDESDPIVMEKKINAATQHGLDGFIFDWYWFSDGSYRIKCLEEGFMKAPNSKDMQFSIMWANHNPIYVHPGSRMYPKPQLLDGAISPETFIKATDHCIKNYFTQPNYMRIDGGLYFSIYSFDRMVKTLGGKAAAGEVFRNFRHRVAQAGLGEVNINTITSMHRELKDYVNLEELNIDSCSSHNWVHGEEFPVFDYGETAKWNAAHNETLTERCKMPYNPLVVMGYDISPRSVQSEIYENVGYPFANIMTSTPAQFEDSLRDARDFVRSDKASGKMVTIMAWNEWTEGSYLEPDEKNGYAYLEAIKKVFRDEA